MTDRSEQLDSILAAAVDLPAAEDRADYIRNACGGDNELQRQVEELVDAYLNAGDFLEPPASGLSPTINFTPDESPGTRIGPYKLLQQIGEGGMGVVYMAEQTEPITRRVALKIIKPGMDTRQVIARFEAERQALAMMDHPNIAKVLDAGVTATGRPYFVMELVRGVPITEYCDAHKIPPRERLKLFIPVCQAIQHAHHKGIIHRDIKPSNVLVAHYDDQPVPKVIDFGVAKATDHRLTNKTMFTEFGQVVGTIEYMSPEQARLNQLDVDTRTDVYSLGVLLYELLAGEPPFDRQRLRGVAFDELLRIIREEEPPWPSSRASTSQSLPKIADNRKTDATKLGAVIRGDLDWIVMKALEKDRTRRYETANGLAADLERFLRDEPVAAGPPTALYRFRKFAKRNKAMLSAAIAVTLLLIIGLISTSLAASHFRRLERTQRQLAEEKSRLLAQNQQLANEREHALTVKLAELYASDENWEKMIAAYGKLIINQPTNSELLARRADAYLATRQWGLAAADLERALSLAPQSNVGEVARRIDELLRESHVAWVKLAPTEMKSERGATLSTLSDNSILASGVNSQGDTYTIIAEADAMRVAAIRLEALTHDSLPNQGPGRDSKHDPGVFYMTNWVISSLMPEHAEAPITLDRVMTDYSVPQAPVSVKQWCIGGGGAQPHFAVYLLKEPIEAQQQISLRFRLHFFDNEYWTGQNLGRFRLSISADAQALEREQERLAAQRSLDGPAEKLALYCLLADDMALLGKVEHGFPGVTGKVYIASERWHDAIVAYSKLIALERDNPSPLCQRANAYLATQQWTLAERDLSRACQLQPQLAKVAFQRFSEVERWHEAADFGLKYIELSPDNVTDWIRVAPLLVLSGDRTAYTAFCAKLVKRFSGINDPYEMDRVCKSCLLAADVIDLSSLPMNRLGSLLDSDALPETFLTWGWGVRALYAYRSNNAELAVEFVDHALAHGPTPEGRALNLAILAMAKQKLQLTGEAQSALEEASKLVPSFNYDEQYYHNRLIVLVLLDEAKALIGGNLASNSPGTAPADKSPADK